MTFARLGAGRALGLLLAIGAGLRWSALITVGDTPALQGDENYYVAAALSMARGQGFPDSARPPGFPFLMSLAFRAAGESLLAARVAQAVASLVGVAIVFDLVRRAFGVLPGFLSGLVCAVHPTLVHYSHFLWAETLYATLMLAAFWSLQRFEHSQRARWLAAAGASLGLAALTREMALYFVPFVMLWVWRVPGAPAGARLRRAGVVALACATAVLPWTARNYARHGRVVIVSTIRWLPFAQGNLLPEADWLYGPISDGQLVARYFAIADEFERERLARDLAEQAVARQQPLWILRKAVRNTYHLFRPVSQLSKFLREGWLRPEAVPLARRLETLERIAYVVLTGLGLAGLWLVPHSRIKWLVAGFVLFSWAVYVLANANHRFRVPFLPLFAIYTGPLLCARTAAARDRWRWVGMGVCLAAFATVLALDQTRGRSQEKDAEPLETSWLRSGRGKNNDGAEKRTGAVKTETEAEAGGG